MIVIGYAVKDPQEEFPIEFDWSQRLPSGDSIQGSTWSSTPAFDTSPPTQLVETSSPAPTIPASHVTRAWLNAGTPLGRYLVTNHIESAQGRVLERTLGVLVRQQ